MLFRSPGTWSGRSVRVCLSLCLSVFLSVCVCVCVCLCVCPSRVPKEASSFTLHHFDYPCDDRVELAGVCVEVCVREGARCLGSLGELGSNMTKLVMPNSPKGPTQRAAGPLWTASPLGSSANSQNTQSYRLSPQNTPEWPEANSHMAIAVSLVNVWNSERETWTHQVSTIGVL